MAQKSAFIDTKAAAAALGVTLRRVQQFIAEGRLPAQRIGRDWLIEEKDLALVQDRKPGRPRKAGARPRKTPSRKSKN